ncbi:6-hydroxymethylpterin diphosphokinase MptE-like protein [Gilvimarinus sp. 1_MG-2023]|uniref:6-hydroxymethylpterin diphosphokinase MptE-like protein n=1 Tax=Gilvimarinus sp. 1_MG-2023 TaxID=3062638 RepID=UPI0026E3A597|nr:6-hydroxymethylpterin diphosphokinase MptE-like protein [Gilvimarinus sp. 1_MG-2023]MDO6746291.1 DUF115 domain-containing protein [Gilvimarinus sp. 1_MG-2023]
MKKVQAMKAHQELDLLNKTTLELEEIYDQTLDRLPSRAPIYLPTERISLVDRILGAQHVQQIYQKDLDSSYRPKLRALREKYRNHKRCFLIGNGPSLNQTDLSVLRDEVTFAVNGFFLKQQHLDWTPTFYVVEDHLVAEDRAQDLKRLTGSIKFFPAYLGYIFDPSDDTIFYNHRPRKSYPEGFDFSMNADEITYTGCTVTFSLMQLAVYLGFREIYLIGVDASYQIPADAKSNEKYSVGVLDMQSDDPNHFNPDYFGKGYRWHDPQVEMMVQAYAEAKRALEGTEQRIYNATIGGQLEIFERRSYLQLFPQAHNPSKVAKHNQKIAEVSFPRLLVIDMTATGNGSATGEVKASLFGDWPASRFLQISQFDKNHLALTSMNGKGMYQSSSVQATEAEIAVDSFKPDIIIYRPVPKVPKLHTFAMETIRQSDCPLVTWLMDDWPRDLELSGSDEWQILGPDLSELLQHSKLRLSICDAMSDAFFRRYGVQFHSYANGVNPIEWPPQRHHEDNCLLLRYSGGLAPNMSLDSLLRIAKSVDILAQQGLNIVLEINTQPWWYKASSHLFEKFKNTTIATVNRTAEEYRNWVSGADITVIAYNHDQLTRRYVRYSMANKMPESLASGAVTFAHGPRGIATIDYLASTSAAVVVEEPTEDAVITSLRSLATNPGLRNKLARLARKIAFEKHNINDLRDDLRGQLFKVAVSSSHEPTSDFHSDALTQSVFSRAANRNINPDSAETEITNGLCPANLQTANRLTRDGFYRRALEQYLVLWTSARDQNNPMLSICRFNALYVARKLGLGSFETMDQLCEKMKSEK